MRLLCSITNQENAYAFSYYLTSQGLENTCDEDEHDSLYRIWVRDEDKVEEAQRLYEHFKANPKDPIYHIRTMHKTARSDSSQESAPKEEDGQKKRRFLSAAPYGPISVVILFTVIALFMWAQFQRGTLIPPEIPGVIQAPLLAPIERTLIYDYPNYFEQRDYLLKIYTRQQIEQKKPPSAEALALLAKLKKTPVWMGIYDRFVNHQQNHELPLAYHGPMFEKIGSGEVWRLFTPALLHFDLLHIFFNVLWFILLGNQIEYRLGWLRYLILILATAIVSNTAQYLMSGPFFMGLSGIVVGMAAFIWARQQVAPWEGYLLNRVTIIFLAIFVIGMFLLQAVFFLLQLSGKMHLTIGIANTAHLAGGIVGYLIGRLPWFSLHSHFK